MAWPTFAVASNRVRVGLAGAPLRSMRARGSRGLGHVGPRSVPHAPSSKSCIATSATQSGSRESDTI